MYRGQFKSYPAIKIYGELGERRKATDKETQRLNTRMKATRWLKGSAYLWGKMDFVREIAFVKAEKINLGKMTETL